jgi:hypothetical protein
MTIATAPLVGMHFRPPAKAILAVLPGHTPLRCVLEPDNPYDANAIAVFIAREALEALPLAARADFEREGEGYGFAVFTALLEREAWQLGYVKATDALHLAPRIGCAIADAGETDEPAWPAHLAFDPAGKPLVQMDLP